MADHNLTPINYKSISKHHKTKQKFEKYNTQKGSKCAHCRFVKHMSHFIGMTMFDKPTHKI